MLAQRRRWRREQGNDGRTRVLVDGESIRLERAPHVRPHDTTADDERAGARAGHEQSFEQGAHVHPLQSTEVVPLAVWEADRQRHQIEIERMSRQHQAELVRLERAYRSANEALMEKVTMILLAERRRPWWRRWIK